MTVFFKYVLISCLLQNINCGQWEITSIAITDTPSKEMDLPYQCFINNKNKLKIIACRNDAGFAIRTFSNISFIRTKI